MFNLAPVGMGRATFRLQVCTLCDCQTQTTPLILTPTPTPRPTSTRRHGQQEILQIGRIPVYLYEDFPWLPYEGSGYSPADLGYIVSQVRPSPTHSLYILSRPLSILI